ncbi:hypothetical protein GCM10023166_35690 [Paeniglutamicibacter cryotolerans]
MLARRIGAKPTACLALALMVAGSIGASVEPDSMVMIFSIVGLGQGLASPSTPLVANLAPREEKAAARRVNGMLHTVGSALGAPIADVVSALGALRTGTGADSSGRG